MKNWGYQARTAPIWASQTEAHLTPLSCTRMGLCARSAPLTFPPQLSHRLLQRPDNITAIGGYFGKLVGDPDTENVEQTLMTLTGASWHSLQLGLERRRHEQVAKIRTSSGGPLRKTCIIQVTHNLVPPTTGIVGEWAGLDDFRVRTNEYDASPLPLSPNRLPALSGR